MVVTPGSSPYPNLPNAPISEALINIRVELPNADLDTLRAFHGRIRSQYPKLKERMAVTAQLTPEHVQTGHGRKPQGFFFTSDDDRQVVQVRPEAFGFSRLRPYENWEALRDEARRVWREFVHVARPQKVTQVSLRYTNHIALPLPVRDFADFFRTIPTLSPQLPQAVSGMFMQLLIPYGENCRAEVVEGLNVPAPTAARPSYASMPFLFDINVVQAVTAPGDSDEVWMHLERLRAIKNQVFFESLTPQALELFR